jgi:uncharacterized membrane protein YeaQ/YmgE (transglycosylase-associated protein family)
LLGAGSTAAHQNHAASGKRDPDDHPDWSEAQKTEHEANKHCRSHDCASSSNQHELSAALDRPSQFLNSNLKLLSLLHGRESGSNSGLLGRLRSAARTFPSLFSSQFFCNAPGRESERRAKSMHLSDQGLIVILVVGLIAGWLAGKVVRGNGFGLVGDAAIGIVGALIGDWLVHRLGIHFSSGIVGLTINAAVGAIVLLLALRLTGASGWGGR